MKELVVDVKGRGDLGKNESRRLRSQGQIPAIVYGARKDPVPVVVDPKKILEIIHSESGVNTIFQLNLAEKEARRHVMIKEYQVDPVKGNLIHADFVRIQMDEVIEVEVPVQVTGEAAGVKLDGGILEHVTRLVRVSCLPGDIPEHITIDVTPLKIGDALRVSDLPTSDRYRILTETDQTLVVVSPPAKEETVAPAAEAAPAAPAEPEVIKKGKVVEEGAAEAEEGEAAKKKEAKKPEGKK
ncbi:MAG TPA: 50S ribosomal protein L25 [Candidatus Polarisedimenticolia bacterium]|nr:50S ribosomal protein L25 [Candidatus Polarisedimenticolia bacterium]